ncbi:hypothetical protein ACA910_001338 [Epithemia clementina (nom. ined.)]
MTETSAAIQDAVRHAVQELEDELDLPVAAVVPSCLRLFVAGDRSSVGKTSTCLGLLGTLLYQLGYTPQELAYIKPATQSEALHQPIQVFCQNVGIQCVPIGPLVYYRGFTRAFMAGETESTAQLLERCAQAVDRVARDKRVVIVDGVGFPSVGSICGQTSASTPVYYNRSPMAVLLVGGSGVGAAVDAYNLNANYFASAKVPVLGAIFNKLSLTGYYALEECRKQVSFYFKQRQEQLQDHQPGSSNEGADQQTPTPPPQPRPFGFVPAFPDIGQGGPDGRPVPLQSIHEFIALFQSHVDVAGILEAATAYQPNSASTSNGKVSVPFKQQHCKILGSTVVQNNQSLRSNNMTPHKQSRHEIEQNAIYSGAAPSA